MNTGKLSAKDVAQTINIDLEDPLFWQKSLNLIIEDINAFKQLANKRL